MLLKYGLVFVLDMQKIFLKGNNQNLSKLKKNIIKLN